MTRSVVAILCGVLAVLFSACAPQGPAGHTAPIAIYTPGEPGRISEDGTKIYYDPKLSGPDQLERLLHEALQRQELYPR